MLFRILQGQSLIIQFDFKWSIFGGGRLLMPSATSSSTVHNTKYLDPFTKTILVLAACS